MFTFVCRQAQEPLPAETAHPARDPPQPGAHSGVLEAQGRQGPWLSRGGLGVGVWEGGGRLHPSLGSAWAAPSHADVCEDLAPSPPQCAVQAEEEAVYEEPPEQETVYEEPPMVGSLQRGVAVKGLPAQKHSLHPCQAQGA